MMDNITIVITEVDDFTYGYGWTPPKRTVTIELTPEQKRKIILNKYERITDVFLQKGTEEESK